MRFRDSLRAGRSPIGLHADLAAVEVAGSEHTGRKLTQGVTAHLALHAETDEAKQSDPENVQKIVKSANQQLAGLQNVGAIVAPPPGFAFKPIEVSNRDMQFLETQQYTREQTCGLYNVHPVLVGATRAATYNNIRLILSSLQREAVDPLLSIVDTAFTSALCWGPSGPDDRVRYVPRGGLRSNVDGEGKSNPG